MYRGVMFGRASYISLLEKFYEAVKNGTGGRFGLVCGPAGIGKTTLVHEFALHHREALFLEGDCTAVPGFELPYKPFLEAFSRVTLDEGVEETGAGGVNRLSAFLKGDRSRSPKLLQILMSYFGFKHLRKEIHSSSWIPVEIYSILAHLASQKILIFYLRNLHRADEVILNILSFLIKNLDEMRVFILAGLSLEDRGERLDTFLKSHDLDLLNLLKTGETDPAGRVFAFRLDHLKSLDLRPAFYGESAVSEKLLVLGEGTPSRLIEVIKYLERSGSLIFDRKSGSWKVSGELTLDCEKRELVMRNCEVLCQEKRRLLLLLAIMPVSLVKKPAELFCSGFTEETLSELLRELVNEGYLRVTPSGVYEFTSVFLREHVLEIAGSGEKEEAARELLLWLGQKKGSNGIEKAVELYLTKIARKYREAVEYSIEAADRYIEILAFNNARELIISALTALLPMVPDPDISLRIQLHRTMGDIAIFNERIDEGEEHFSVAMRLLEMNEKRTSRTVTTVMRHFGFLYLLGSPGLFRKAIDILTRGLILASSDRLERLKCSNLLGLANFLSDNPGLARAFFSDSLKIVSQFKSEGELRWELDSAYRGLAAIYLREGDYRKALAYMQKVLQIAESFPEKRVLAHAHQYTGMIYFKRAQWQKSIECYEKAIRVHGEIGDVLGLCRVFTSLGVTYFARGELEKAAEKFECSLKIARRASDKRGIAIQAGNLARVLVYFGELERAASLRAEDLELVTILGDRYGEAYAYCFKGEAEMIEKDWTAALESYKRAYEISNQSGYFETRLLAGVGLIGAYVETGNIYEATLISENFSHLALNEENRLYAAMLFRARSKIERASRKFHRASQFLNQAMVIFEKAGVPLEIAWTCYEEGILARDKKDRESARNHFAEAMERFRSCGAKYLVERMEGEIAALQMSADVR